MSIFKSNKFFRIIKHFVLCLPLMFVLSTSLYTIVNPNAKDSYSGVGYGSYDVATPLYETNEVVYNNGVLDLDSVVNGNRYLITFDNAVISSSFNDFIIGDSTSLIFNDFMFPDNGVYQLVYRGYILQSNNAVIFIRDTSITENIISFGYNSGNNVLDNKLFVYPIVILNKNNINLNNSHIHLSVCTDDFMKYTYETHYSSELNNAFEFGMYQFNQIGFGAFDFVSWFNGIFTTSVNNVYLNFINSYLNYYLMVEIVYFVPWVIHKFIHFAYDLGDYFTDGFKRRKEDD